MKTDPKLVEQFSEKARAAAAVVRTVESAAEAFEYAVSVCRNKEACRVLASGCEHPLSEPAAEICGLKQWEKLMAAPELEQNDLETLTKMCRQAGTIVLRCPGEDLRLATMISEIHIAVIRAEDIYPLDAVSRTGAQILATDCPGCVMQLRGEAVRQGRSFSVLHMAEALAGMITPEP